MKNKIIERELNKVAVADLSDYDESTGIYTIPKHVDLVLEEDNCYIISININKLKADDYAYLVNWNKTNVIPEHEYMKIDVIKKLSNMFQVNGLYYDYDNKVDLGKTWSGWLPQNVIKIVSKL